MLNFHSETIIVHLGEPNALLIPIPASERERLSFGIGEHPIDMDGTIGVAMVAPMDDTDPVYQIAVLFASAEAQLAFLRRSACDFRIVANSELGQVCNAAGAITHAFHRPTLH